LFAVFVYFFFTFRRFTNNKKQTKFGLKFNVQITIKSKFDSKKVLLKLTSHSFLPLQYLLNKKMRPLPRLPEVPKGIVPNP
jgi:hypothetical protein